MPVCRKLTAPGAVGDKGQQVSLFRSHRANCCCCCSGQGASKQPARLHEARRACPHGADCCRCCRGKGQQLPLLRHHGHDACHAAGAAWDRHAQHCLQLTAAGAAGDKGAATSLRERIKRAAGEDDALLILAESLVKVARQAASGAPGAAAKPPTGSGCRTYSGACRLVPLQLPHCTIATLRGIPPTLVSKQPTLIPSHLGWPRPDLAAVVHVAACGVRRTGLKCSCTSPGARSAACACAIVHRLTSGSLAPRLPPFGVSHNQGLSGSWCHWR